MDRQIERLTEKHDCRKFRCGEHILDNFRIRHALKNDRQGVGSTYVAPAETTDPVKGDTGIKFRVMQGS